MRLFTTIAAVVMFMAAAGCIEMDIPPAGSYSSVTLISELGRQDPLARQLRPYLARQLDYYVGKEPQFKIRDVRASSLTQPPQVKNIVIVGVADPLTDVGHQIASMLGEDAVAKAMSGQATIFKKENLPGPGQMTIIVTAGSEAELVPTGDWRAK